MEEVQEKGYSTAAVAKVLGVKPATVSAMCKTGRIGSTKKSEGGRYLCTAAHVTKWIRDHSPGGAFVAKVAVADSLDEAEKEVQAVHSERRAAGAKNRGGYGKYPKALSFALGEKTLAAFRTTTKEQGTGCAAVLRDAITKYLASHDVHVVEDTPERPVKQAA